MAVINLPGDHVFAFARPGERGGSKGEPGASLQVLASFSEEPQTVDGEALGGGTRRDLISGREFSLHGEVSLEPYQLLWLQE